MGFFSLANHFTTRHVNEQLLWSVLFSRWQFGIHHFHFHLNLNWSVIYLRFAHNTANTHTRTHTNASHTIHEWSECMPARKKTQRGYLLKVNTHTHTKYSRERKSIDHFDVNPMPLTVAFFRFMNCFSFWAGEREKNVKWLVNNWWLNR